MPLALTQTLLGLGLGNMHRYKELEQLYVSHRIAHQVAHNRTAADRVIKENHY